MLHKLYKLYNRHNIFVKNKYFKTYSKKYILRGITIRCDFRKSKCVVKGMRTYRGRKWKKRVINEDTIYLKDRNQTVKVSGVYRELRTSGKKNCKSSWRFTPLKSIWYLIPLIIHYHYLNIITCKGMIYKSSTKKKKCYS